MSISLWWSLVSQELRRVFSYRVNFWMQFFTQTIGEVAVAYYLWRAIFEGQGVTKIGDFTFDGIVSYYIFVALAGRIIRGRENFLVSSEIYEGSLTKYLLYPVNYLVMKLSEHFGFVLLSILQLTIGLVGLMLIFSDSFGVFENPERFFLGVLASVSASFFYYMLLFTVELVSFWADNVWSLSVMARFIVGFFGGIVVPLSLMPAWAQEILALTPFPSIGSIPVRLFIGDAGLNDFLWAQGLLLMWMIPLLLISSWMWRAGTYRYTGVGQ